ncbi:MAG TPA: hypothetical protein VMI13_00915 [Solirubrobacteraceae bacterium]|nr:hypothetical protein [Solirubrobacteraceae bacterium]
MPDEKPVDQDERFKIEDEDPEDVLRELRDRDRDELVPQDEPLKDQGDSLES